MDNEDQWSPSPTNKQHAPPQKFVANEIKLIDDTAETKKQAKAQEKKIDTDT